MDSLQELLGRYSPKEPDEVSAVKRYIAETFNAASSVGLHGETLVITVASASLANALRLRLPALKKAANTQRRIMFRIG
jgi:hypothetical protein